jgi:uncharacterized protein with von Willebrand factor type A (vWA) domain
MIDIEELVKRLREAARTGKPDGWTMLAVSEWNDAADVIEALQTENAELRTKCDHIMTQHGERLSENARIRSELDDANAAKRNACHLLDVALEQNEALKTALEPRRWTQAMSDAWHLSTDTHTAFEALLKATSRNQG